MGGGELVFTKQVSPPPEPCSQGVKSPLRGLGVFVQLEYKLTQYEIYEQLVRGLIKYFECGYLIRNRN